MYVCVENLGTLFITHSDTPAVLIHPWWRKQPQGTQDMYSYTCSFFTPTLDRRVCIYINTF